MAKGAVIEIGGFAVFVSTVEEVLAFVDKPTVVSITKEVASDY